MPAHVRLLRLVMVAALCVLLPAPVSAGHTAVGGFFGVVPQAPLGESDWERIGRAGLTVRMPIDWGAVEPEPGNYDFTSVDETIATAARHGVRIVPQLGGSPAWIAPSFAHPPLAPVGLAAWRRFLRQVVLRYGFGGSFWRGQEQKLPIRRWQIWNEPNYPLFWRPRPSPRGYVRLLRASAAAIRSGDPKAVVVAAGVAPVERQPPPWEFLRAMYQVPGARAAFDVVALHPYTPTVAGLRYEIEATRQVMAEAGDAATPLLISEVGAASDAQAPTGFDLGRRGQARFLERTFSLLYAYRRHWRLAGVYWFTWADAADADANCPFCQYAGLFDRRGRAKPAWRALLRLVHRYSRAQVR